MIYLAFGIFSILAVVAGLHLFWAFGGLWPARSATALAQTVIGSDGRNGMPGRGLTIFVAILIFAAGALPFVHLSETLPTGLSRTGLWALVLIFLGRGLATYALPNMAAKMSQPFRRLNAQYFSPLCLVLGAGFLVLVINT